MVKHLGREVAALLVIGRTFALLRCKRVLTGYVVFVSGGQRPIPSCVMDFLISDLLHFLVIIIILVLERELRVLLDAVRDFLRF